MSRRRAGRSRKVIFVRGKRSDKSHPHAEDRERDRVRETRARLRMKRRWKRGMVGSMLNTASRGDAMPAPWKMNATGAPDDTGCGGAQASEPLTEELLHELLDAPSPTAFTDRHGIEHRSLADYLNELLERRGLKRADVVRAAGLNETFGYQIFKGQRNPSRDKVLQIALAMELGIRETNRLLKAAGVNELYCKDRRDAIVLFCVDHGYSLQKTNEELYRFDEETLG